jgi:hypothetical protein
MKDFANPTFKDLMWLDNHLNDADFIKLFGEELGSHLINKRCKYDNILYFFNTLDVNVQKILGRFACEKREQGITYFAY